MKRFPYVKNVKNKNAGSRRKRKQRSMKSSRKIFMFIIGFVLTGSLISIVLPSEREKNPEAEIRIGAGDDISGILMKETMENLSERYTVHESLESTSFQDC